MVPGDSGQDLCLSVKVSDGCSLNSVLRQCMLESGMLDQSSLIWGHPWDQTM